MNEQTRLSGDATSAASARRFVANVLSNGGFANDCIEDAVLLASEVVTNAIIHAGSDLDVVVVADPPMARVEVYASNSAAAVPVLSDGQATLGYGLHVVEALAEAWGVEHHGGGKCVWFEVRG